MSMVVGDETDEELECKLLLLGAEVQNYLQNEDMWCLTHCGTTTFFFTKIFSPSPHKPWKVNEDRRALMVEALRAIERGEETTHEVYGDQ